jgi:CubicO group peptidase (beta-lactamase class C family)
VRAADSVVSAWVEEGLVPGAVLVVSRDDRVVLERSYGWARTHDFGGGQYAAWRSAFPTGSLRALEDPVPMTTSTVFDLASVTKVMATTFASMLLVDDGAVELDAPVHAYLPDFRGGGKDRITVRHLLTHRSGLAQWLPVYYHAADPDGAYAYVRDVPLGWEPGEGRHYSDLGFMVLGRLVERVSGQSLGAFLEERLYGPIGLEATGFRPAQGAVPERGPAEVAEGTSIAATSHGNPYEYRMVHDSTFGYRIGGDADAWDGWRRRTLVGEVNDGNAWHAFGGVAGHAGLFSTAGELRTLVQLLLDGGERAGRRFVNPSVVEAFLSTQVEGQALGWQLPDYGPAGSFAHTGFTGTYVLGLPSEGLAVVLLTNRQNGGVDADGGYPDVGPLQRAVVRALIGRRSPPRRPDRFPEAPPGPPAADPAPAGPAWEARW